MKKKYTLSPEILGTVAGRIMAAPRMPMATFIRLVNMLPSMV